MQLDVMSRLSKNSHAGYTGDPAQFDWGLAWACGMHVQTLQVKLEASIFHLINASNRKP